MSKLLFRQCRSALPSCHGPARSRPNTPRVRRFDTVNENFMAALRTKRIALQNFRAAFNKQTVSCTSLSFDELPTPSNAVVYCDPPYIGSQSSRAMSPSGQKQLETFLKACIENNCDVYLSNDKVPEFDDDTLKVCVIKTWSNFRNKTDSIHKNARGRTELFMKIHYVRELSKKKTVATNGHRQSID
jgi:site-specific DNA-adenine methylase